MCVSVRMPARRRRSQGSRSQARHRHDGPREVSLFSFFPCVLCVLCGAFFLTPGIALSSSSPSRWSSRSLPLLVLPLRPLRPLRCALLLLPARCVLCGALFFFRPVQSHSFAIGPGRSPFTSWISPSLTLLSRNLKIVFVACKASTSTSLRNSCWIESRNSC